MESPLVSIIIPVYNVEKYLRRCLESVRNQTYKNIEVILVDDGSPDNCPAICDEYAEMDKRFHVIHKENGGVSSARNAGLDYCKKSVNTEGYVAFVDSDDWLPKKAMETLVVNGCTNDFIVGNYTTVLISGGKYNNLYEDDCFPIRNAEKFSKCFGAVCTPWGKLFSKSVICEHDIRFPSNMAVNEDSYFVFDFIGFCGEICTCSGNVYYYSHLSRTSLTRKYYPELDKYYISALEKKLRCYDGNSIPLIEQSRVIELFFVASKHYVTYLPQKSAVEKIEETHRLFEKYLKMIDKEKISCLQNHFVRLFAQYFNLLEERNYVKLYEFFYENKSRKNFMINLIRKILLPIEQFLVFNLGMFYK